MNKRKSLTITETVEVADWVREQMTADGKIPALDGQSMQYAIDWVGANTHPGLGLKTLQQIVAHLGATWEPPPRARSGVQATLAEHEKRIRDLDNHIQALAGRVSALINKANVLERSVTGRAA
jgi:hypothetical protein